MTHLFVIKRQLLAYIFMCEDHTCGTFFFVIKKKRQYLLCKMQFLKN